MSTLSRRSLLTLCGLGSLHACSQRRNSEKVRVAASIFPLFDLTRRIAGDRLEVLLVLPPGRSEHSYDPTPQEMVRVASARLAISVGLGMDAWLERIVRGAAGASVPIEQLGPQANPRVFTHREVGEDAADSHEEPGEHEHEEHEHEHHEHQPGAPDPHFWLDPVRAGTVTTSIARALSRVDAAGAAEYQRRAGLVQQQLTALHNELTTRARAWNRRRIVTFHGSMGYFAERYDLTIAAVIEPFPGREPTARYLSEVLAAIRGANVAALFSEPQLDRRPAQVIATQASLPLFELDPVGGSPGADSYEKLLRRNADVLDRALR